MDYGLLVYLLLEWAEVKVHLPGHPGCSVVIRFAGQRGTRAGVWRWECTSRTCKRVPNFQPCLPPFMGGIAWVLLGAFRYCPQIRQDYPPNLSILLSGGKETNQDSPSNGE
jgi:hypothetical protein